MLSIAISVVHSKVAHITQGMSLYTGQAWLLQRRQVDELLGNML